MSFCNNQSNDRCPGNINGNPINGLCEKVCVEVNKVFDACISQNSLESVTVSLTNITPPNPTLPLTFVSGRSTSNVGDITSLTVTPITTDNKGLSRVQATISVPIQINYVDADNIPGQGTTSISVTEDVIMCVPSGSIIEPEITATVNMSSPRGSYVGGFSFNITACVTVVLKVIAKVELLIPSYGYCKIPQCTEFTQDVCQGVFDMPLFPR